MRDDLIGYLLNALEPDEQELVEARLSRDPQLANELKVLSRSLAPLAMDKGEFEPPPGLATRTCEFVAVQSKRSPAPAVISMPSRWSMADLAVAAGIFLAATLLFWPAMNQSRFAARVLSCQDNLQKIGMGLANYSNLHRRQFPSGSLEGNTNAAGMYAVLLNQHRMVPHVRVFICPGSALAATPEDLQIPTSEELIVASPTVAAQMRQRMGGTYGYSLGYVINGKYYPPRDLRRAARALMADAPNANSPSHHSLNHDECGQNVLFEDLHVKYMTTCRAHGCDDDIFVNDDGETKAGLHEDDSVIGPSHAAPIPVLPDGTPAVVPATDR